LRKKLPPNLAPGLHPKSRHGDRYDFAALVRADPGLKQYVLPSPAARTSGIGAEKPALSRELSIDFADPAAVFALNRALLLQMYGVRDWFLPEGYLIPPIPGRTDYVHHLAALIAEQGHANAPARILDIGTGANCIYPIIGAHEYAWRFVATDIDITALENAERIARANPHLLGALELRHQLLPAQIFSGVVRAGEHFAACMCNPPFHASKQAATAGSARKVANLTGTATRNPTLNFAGQAAELYCPGGELGFIRRMITQSAAQPALCDWFSVLVAKQVHVGAIKNALTQSNVAECRVIQMRAGQKHSRIIAWRF
jgi:23S rRNA (adenine1618-N6)-methyltransferase